MSLVLQLDGGNTRLKWRILDSQSQVFGSGALSYSEVGEDRISSASFINSISKVYCASVKVCQELNDLLGAYRDALGCAQVIEVDHGLLAGVEFAYEDVSRLGIDRCLALVGAKCLSDQSFMVIDAGSALTADLLDAQGCHIGGYIFPGVSMLRRALLGETSKIDVRQCVLPSLDPGTTTELCVSNALELMLTATLERLREVASGFGVVQVLVTGGDAPKVSEVYGGEVRLVSDLVFKGMDALINNKAG